MCFHAVDRIYQWFVHVQLDEVMGTATAVAGRVGEQSRIFENIGNKVLAVGAKFPAINGVINAVRRKKSKVGLPNLPQKVAVYLSSSANGAVLLTY